MQLKAVRSDVDADRALVAPLIPVLRPQMVLETIIVGAEAISQLPTAYRTADDHFKSTDYHLNNKQPVL